jgi:hypothetical protein
MKAIHCWYIAKIVDHLIISSFCILPYALSKYSQLYYSLQRLTADEKSRFIAKITFLLSKYLKNCLTVITFTCFKVHKIFSEIRNIKWVILPGDIVVEQMGPFTTVLIVLNLGFLAQAFRPSAKDSQASKVFYSESENPSCPGTVL